MTTFTLNIIAPERVFFSGEALQVNAPGTEGDFGVLAGHMPFITSLRPGVVEVIREGQPSLRLAVAEGVAEVTPDHCTILAASMSPLDGMNLADAQVELRAAEENRLQAQGEEQQKAAAKRLLLAQAVVEALKH